MDGPCVCVVLKVVASRRQRTKALRKKRLAHAQRRRRLAQRQAQERLFFAVMMSIFALSFCLPPRSLWTKERSSYWWDHIVNHTFSTRDWLDNFRMSQATFVYVCDELRSAIEKTDTEMRKPIPVEQRVALTLWYLATNTDYWTIGHLFGISKATVCMVTKEVCAAIVKVLLPTYIRVPGGDEL